MPNLVPPLTSASDAMAYKQRLQQEDSSINYLMTLYLHEKITPAVVKGAKAQGIVGIKSYPAGVTTNSSSGVLDYEVFYPVFRAMEQCGMVLNLHGECPSDHGKNITILNGKVYLIICCCFLLRDLRARVLHRSFIRPRLGSLALSSWVLS
jgi:dihydroorotase